MTLPFEPSTLPKRTAENTVLDVRAYSCTTISPMRFVAPMTLVGFTALSVEMKMKRAAPNASAAFTTFKVPNTLLCSASRGHASMSGAGATRHSCRQSSLPMEPPPPVTSTHSPAM